MEQKGEKKERKSWTVFGAEEKRAEGGGRQETKVSWTRLR